MWPSRSLDVRMSDAALARDALRVRVYAPLVPLPTAQATGTAATGGPQTPRRRRPPSRAEQERRKAWGKEWGRVGAEHAKLIRAREA